MDELLVAVNPDLDSRLSYLLRLPLGGGMVFCTSGTWPRTKALYCYPVDTAEWPSEPDIVERAPIRSCVRRGAAIDVILDRARENRSQLVFTTARGRDAVFWQSPRTRKQARPNVATPTARAASIANLQILVDTREQYAYRFAAPARKPTLHLPAHWPFDERVANLYADVDPDGIVASAPGVGPVISAVIAGRIGDPHRFTSLAAIRAYTGRTGPQGQPVRAEQGRVLDNQGRRPAAA